MKKTSLSIATALALAIAGSANADILSEGEQVAGGALGLSLASWDNAINFGANYERGVIDDIFPDVNLGAGVLAQYSNYGTFDYDLSITTLAAQANLHYDLGIDNFQPYAGLLLAFSVVSASQFGSSSLGLGAQIGGRYYFQDNLAATVRLNTSSAGFGGYSILSAGVDYKF